MGLKKKSKKNIGKKSYAVPKILGFSFDTFSVYLGFFIMLALIIMLSNASNDLLAYSTLINYIAIFEITVSIGIFTYIGAVLKNKTPAEKYYTKYLTIYAEIMLVSTIIFVLSLFLLPANNVLNKSSEILVVAIGGWVSSVSSILLIASVMFFISAMIETVFLMFWKMYKNIFANWKIRLKKMLLPKNDLHWLSKNSEYLFLILSIVAIFFSVGLANYWTYNEEYHGFLNLNNESRIYDEFNKEYKQYAGSELIDFDKNIDYFTKLSCDQDLLSLSFNDGNERKYSMDYLCSIIGLNNEALSDYFMIKAVKRLYYLNYMKMEFLYPQIEKNFKDKWYVLSQRSVATYGSEYEGVYQQMIASYYKIDSLVGFSNTSEYVQLIKEMNDKKKRTQSAFELLWKSGLVLLMLIILYFWCIKNKNNLLYGSG